LRLEVSGGRGPRAGIGDGRDGESGEGGRGGMTMRKRVGNFKCELNVDKG